MSKLILGLCCLSTLLLSGQQDQEQEVKQTIMRFFEGFHKQDSLIMKSVIGPNPILQTLGRNKEGLTEIRNDSFDRLVEAIVSIPDTVKFEERIHSYQISIDGPMANAWTPYEFWLNDQFSHCGVNSFQLINDGSSWKIIYLIDTRRREDCQ
ncbi:MAG: nuclear transport factor 2 family protein [Eudoraea sp.]|nr:nuclear transport factor 2 family protein [Eudoraea sp.]MBT8208987.1 nuclear transport factor 2 family protein [Eudoraea sp.]NNK31422.1 nuclear transport factor 2 family protein [Flavobacteriaceae bacterium]